MTEGSATAGGGTGDALGEFLARSHITLRIGSHQLRPGPQLWERVRAAVEQSNAPRRFEGLPDQLNAELLDPARVEAFLRYLPSVDLPTVERLRDRVLYVNAPDLGLGSGSPYTMDAIARGYQLSVPVGPAGRIAMPRLIASADASTMTGRIAEVECALGGFEQQVAQLQEQLRRIDSERDPDAYADLSNQLGDSKYRRFQVSIVWRNLLRAAYDAQPTNPQLASAARAADQAVQRLAVPPRCGNDD